MLDPSASSGPSTNNKCELIAMNRNRILIIVDGKNRDRERYPVVYGAKINVADGAPVKAN